MSGHDEHGGGHDGGHGGGDSHASESVGGGHEAGHDVHASPGASHGGGDSHGGGHAKSGGGLLSLFSKKKKHEPSADELHHEIHELEEQYKSKIKAETKGDPVLERLHEFGFAHAEKDKKGNITGWTGQESFEKFQHRIVKTEFPTPSRRFRLMLEYPDFNIEQTYYWFLRYYNESWGFDKVEKVIDTNAASVASSQFGNMQSRIGAQQNQASQYLKGISEMIKGLFQIVREVRVIDERLQYYYDSDGDPKGMKETKISSEIVLKGLWIDQVEGGSKNPGSVYGLAQTIGFTILPDLFFRIKVQGRETIERDVDTLKFNAKVKEVLKRKLRQYYEWKWRTKKELEARRNFEIKYMKQHYDTIKIYMEWTKPYLRNIRRLQLYEHNMENPHIIHSFESQILEIETLFVRDDFGAVGSSAPKKAGVAVISLHIFFRVKPELSFHAYEYQNKGPIHTGMADVTIRSYEWTKDKLEAYKKYRQNDDLDLMKSVDSSISAAMDALGDDLKKYLKEADPSLYFAEKGHGGHGDEPHGPDNFLTPFIAIFKGFGDLFGSFGGNKSDKPKKEKYDAKDKFKDDKISHRAKHFADEACFEGYLRYKMGPGGNLYWVDPG
jgi:hypothetical protein